MRSFIPIFSLLFFTLFYSCSFEDVKSSENYITGFKIDNVNSVDETVRHDISKIIVYTFDEYYDAFPAAAHTVYYSENAMLDSTGRDWTAEGFSYIVTAENGEKRSYSIGIEIVQKKFGFETWNYSKGNNTGYYVPSGLNSSWTSGNAGISMAFQILERDSDNPKIYPTRDTTGVNGGSAVLMETLEGGTVFNRKTYLFSGNLIFGNFNTREAITDELSAIELGRIYPAAPKSVKFYYKYKEGPGVFDSSGVQKPGRNDVCSMYAYFYRSNPDSPGGEDVILTVKNIDESDRVIAKASMTNCVQTEGEDFKFIEVPFNYKSEPDWENHSYKLGMTFAASKDGDKFAGKIGSKLIVDEIEFTDFEDEN